MPVIRVKPETLERVVKAIEAVYPPNVAKRVVGQSSWDMKINLLLDVLEGSVCYAYCGFQTG